MGFVKKTGEGKSKSEVGFKKVNRDNENRKYALKVKEQRYKDMVKKRGSDKAAESARRLAIQKLTKKERAVKSRQRQDQTKMNTMRAKEHGSKRAKNHAINRVRHAAHVAAHNKRAEKNAAANVKRQSSEGGTKHAIRTERHYKHARALSVERHEKAQHALNHKSQKKMHAGAKVADQKCIMICHEGRKHMDSHAQRKTAAEMEAKGLKKGAKKGGEETVFMMHDNELGEGGFAQPAMTKAEKELAEKAHAHRKKTSEISEKARLVPAKLKIPKHK